MGRGKWQRHLAALMVLCIVITQFWLLLKVEFPINLFTSSDDGGAKKHVLRNSALIVHEHFPMLWEGGDMRVLQVAELLASHAESPFKKNVIFLGRAKSTNADPTLYERMESAGIAPFPVKQLSMVFESPAGPGAQLTNPYDVSNISLAILGFWSFKLSASGDPFPTIPETFSLQIRMGAPHACIIILSDDIQHRRFQVEMGLTHSQQDRLKHRELAVYHDADVVLFVSKMDKLEVHDMLLKKFGKVQPRLAVLPYVDLFQRDAISYKSFMTPFEDRYRMVLVSGGSRSSFLAVKWILSKILPRVQSQIAAICTNLSTLPPLTLVGSAFTHLDNREDVEALGYVEDVASVFSRARVAFAPSLVASGISSKMHLSLAHAIPTVGTSHAFRDIESMDHYTYPFAVHDDPDTFADTAARIYCSKDLFWQMSNSALRFYDAKAREHQQINVFKSVRTCSHFT